MSKVELKKETSELHITVESDKITWETSQEKAFKKIKSNLVLKGFRKGQVPDNVAKKSIAISEILTEALKIELEVLVKNAAKEIKNDLIILDSPAYNVVKISESELVVTFIYPVYPEIKLSNYKSLGIKYLKEKAKEEEIDLEINKILASQTIQKEKNDGILEKSNIAIFDFEGFVDGKVFEGGKAENYELEIGSGHFIAGFEDQMVGMKIGEEKDIKVTFPEEYHVESLKGKKSVFKIKLNSMKEKIVPKLSDDLIKTLNVPSVSTIKELREYILNVKNQELTFQARSKFQREAFDKILKDSSIIIPAQLLSKEMHNQEHIFTDNLKKQGLSLKQYMEMSKMTKETLMSQFKTMAEQKIYDSFIFAEISKLEKIKINDEDYEKEYLKFAKIYGQSLESIKGLITKEQMQIPMTNDRVLDIMIEAHSK